MKNVTLIITVKKTDAIISPGSTVISMSFLRTSVRGCPVLGGELE